MKQSGFTLIELLVVIGIFAILASIGLFFSMDFFRTYSTTSEETTLVSTLSKARSQSLANINGYQHGVRITGTGYTIFEGPGTAGTPLTWATRITASDQVIPVGSSVHSVTNTDVVFAQLSGNATCTSGCAINMTGGGYNKTISINSEGAILW
ncbi:MAG TPA: prepilin-type N-terminal cleavage/methylation domain-containing protein [Patescibacteria group bacterium]|nr:prepilin-type N-terminal cleavage/methylation domain-containing protein [Patescibacteria group bacterium]